MNSESTGDRDLYFSWVLRQPVYRNLRSCDYDSLPELAPTLICNRCNLPVLLLEATRQRAYKATRYTAALARKVGIPAYLVRHSGAWGSFNNGSDRFPSMEFEVTRLSDSEVCIFTGEIPFIAWLERRFAEHNCT